MDKRTFLKHFSVLGVSTPMLFPNLDKWIAEVEGRSPQEIAQDESFWLNIRSGYRLKPDYINLENGYYCIIPQETLENFIHHVREVNYQGSYYMRTAQWDNKHLMQSKLAEIADCSPDELVITRNTTESLDTIIGGFPWKAGDEAIMALQDYGAMQDMFTYQETTKGVKLVTVSLPNHPSSDEEIVDLYEQAITPRTKLMMVCHLVNITGQILPIKKIVEMAHSHGVEVMVDGAHAFGHIQFSLQDLGCDYYGTSLHKWMSTPLGAGFLYIKKDKIPQISPRFADHREGHKEDIRRLNHTGTHPVHTDLAINNAIEYYHKLGPERKEARLRYIQHYWTSKVRDLPHIIVNTPVDQQRHCAIGNVGVKGMEPRELADTLMDTYKIWTVAINRPGVRGVRVTPNIYTTTRELDSFVAALKALG